MARLAVRPHESARPVWLNLTDVHARNQRHPFLKRLKERRFSVPVIAP